MRLRELSKIIYADGMESESRKIKIISHADKRVLWEGKAKDLQNWERIGGWIVVEVLIDFEDEINLVDYNKGKIITVI